MDDPVHYTHAEWHVHPGREGEFIDAWRALAAAFGALPARPLWGTLLQSERDPTTFFSFGPWHRAEDIGAMRDDAAAQAALARVTALCRSATPGPCRRVAHVDLRERAG
jgi:hypothetical protein